jgi:fructose-1-phosphate kinase PfkB-like protein
MTADKLCEQMLRIITEGNLPFLFAENSELVKLLKHAYPGVIIPNRRSVAAKLKSNVAKSKQQLKERLAKVDSKISLALDAWTTRNNVAFLGMWVCHVRCNRNTFP